MTDRVKAASISLAVIVAITALKFFLYYISGSIAVLSEAWHSFSDIATTLLVVISIFRQRHKDSNQPSFEPPKTLEEPSRSSLLFSWFSSVDTELKAAGVISLVLLSVSVSILWQGINYTPTALERPLITGVIFIVLSFGSFFLYRFQDSIGRQSNSAALRADSQHNRADMAISLLTGASLILYHFGYDFDRWVSIYIAIFIFTFAAEMAINVLVSLVRGGEGLTAEYSFSEICAAAFSSGTHKKIVGELLRHFPRLENKRSLFQVLLARFKFVRRWTLIAASFIGCLFWLKTSVFTVKVDEEALLLRFGQVLQQEGTLGPGLHWKLPWPFDQVERFPTRRIFTLAVGNAADSKAPMIWGYDHGDSTTFISGDNNLFLPYLVIHYRIRDPRSYYLGYRKGAVDDLLEYQAYRSLSHSFATMGYYDIALFEREKWIADAEKSLQQALDAMGAGIEIVAFCLRDLHPPKDIATSFENVVAAHQNRQQRLNHAERYYHTKLPVTRGKAHRALSDAEGNRLAQLTDAEGEAESYSMRLEGYNSDPRLGKRLLKFQAAQKSLSGKSIFLVDPRSGVDSRMVYFEKYMSREKTK